jgi:hypothetical protein
MADDKKDPWMNWLALTTIVFAVAATLSTFKGGGHSTRSMISQMQASDQWAFFQSKSTKEAMYRLEKENLELQAKALPRNADTAVVRQYQSAVAEAAKSLDKYEKEKTKIQDSAKFLEGVRDEAQKHGKPFGMAVIFLQVAILLSSVAGLLKKQYLYWLALPTGAWGLVLFANGFFLFL